MKTTFKKWICIWSWTKHKYNLQLLLRIIITNYGLRFTIYNLKYKLQKLQYKLYI